MLAGSPSKVPGEKRSAATMSSSGLRREGPSRAPGSTPPPPKLPAETTKSLVNWSSKMLLNEAFTEEATMVIVPTRATPMRRAAAVREVRFGLRMAFAWASRPVMPRKRRHGPAEEARRPGLAKTGPRAATPRNTSATPRPMAGTCPPASPASTSTMASTVTTAPRMSRIRELPRSSVATSRMAARGGTDAPFQDGKMAATTVMPTPTTRVMMIVDVFTTKPCEGSSKPTASSTLSRSAARPMPARSPKMDASRPTATASASSAPRTWRRLAPMAREQSPSPGSAGQR